MTRCLAYTSLLVPDYDQAIAFFTQVLRWQLLEDTPMSPDKRWVRVAAGDSGGTLLLARAGTPEQLALVGRQWAGLGGQSGLGGRVGLFLHTDSFDEDMAHLRAHGVQFHEAPRSEAYGRVVVFSDPWGNRWDLIEPRASTSTNMSTSINTGTSAQEHAP